MTIIKCPSDECKWNDNNYCTAEEINLGWYSIMTKHDGRQEFWRCNRYEMTPEEMEKFERLKEFLMNRRLDK